MGSRTCSLHLALLFLLQASSHVVAGRASRRLLECVGSKCARARGPPNLSMSWGSDRMDGRAGATGVGGWAVQVAIGMDDVNEKVDVGGGVDDEGMAYPEVEAQQYYKLGVLETLAQTLTGEDTALSVSGEERQICNSIPMEMIRYANLVILSRALEVTGLAETLNSKDLEATMFAPTDLAFETLAESQGITVEELLKDTEYLSKVLKLHLAPNALRTSVLGASQSIDTYLIGHPILVTSSEKGILVVPPGGDAAHIQLADISACNSVIHIVDHVLSYVEDWDLGMFTG